MVTRLRMMLAILILALAWINVVPAGAELNALGEPMAPHGYPRFYTDANGLSLEPCLPADQFGTETIGGIDTQVPVGYATRPDLCFFDPVDPNNPESVRLGVGAESFWWMADAVMDMPGGGRALLVQGLEGAFGGVGDPEDGQQISFGRIRIRVDAPVAGTYTVTHPFGTETFTNVPAGTRTINVTEDIGAINQLTPALGFGGALAAEIGPFLTWPDYETDPTLQVFPIDPVTSLPDTNADPLEQYVGDPNVPHTVTGSPIVNADHPSGFQNFFRVEYPGAPGAAGNTIVETDLFNVMGKVYDANATPARLAHTFPDAPVPNLFAVGPINREVTLDQTPIVPPPPVAAPGVTGVDNNPYPVGYPIWVQDNNGTIVAPQAGLQLTYCPPTDAMCISAPIDLADPNSVLLRVGEEGFFWTGEAFINDQTPDLVGNLPAGLDGILVMAVEGAFGGAGSPAPGQQILFARIRVRVDVPVAGDYTITHPYGVEVFEGVTVVDGINMTRDVMIADPANPDSGMIGVIYGDIGPKFLTWDTFDPTLAANDPLLQRLSDPTDVASPMIHYVGDPAVEHAVIGSPNDTNFFRIEGPNGIDVQTNLFAVTGKVYDEATFNLGTNAALPVANPDVATLDMGQATSVNIPVLANDEEQAGVQATATNVTTAIVTPPVNGTAVVQADGSITYTPDAAFAVSGGVDTITYNITSVANTALVSNNADVTVTVVPVETITVDRARFDTRRLRLELRGTSNFPGTTLTIRAGATEAGAVIGTVQVGDTGRWSFRGTATTNLTAVTVVSSTGTVLENQTLQVR